MQILNIRKLIIVILALFSLNAYAVDCEKGDKNPCNLKKSEVLTDIFEQVVLKVSDFLSGENVRSLEDFSNIVGRNLSEQDIERFSKKFSQYARPDQLNFFVNSLTEYSYWNKDKRLENNQAAMVILLINEKYTLGLTEEEIDVIWFMQNVNEMLERQKGKFSYEFNNYNLSNQIIKLTGAMKGSRPLMKGEVENLLRKITHINCFESYRDVLDTDLKTLFWEVSDNPQSLSLRHGNIILNGEEILNPAQIESLLGQAQGRFDDDRGLLDSNLSFKDYFKKKEELNKKDDVETIKGYHKYVLDVDYAIVDKRKKSIKLFNSDGFLIDEGTINIGLSDKVNHSGAGVYQVNEGEEGKITFTSEKGLKNHSFDSSIDLPLGTKVYILGAEKGNKFVIKNYKLNFVSDKKRDHYNSYNYSNRDKQYFETEFKVEGNDNDFISTYLETLGSEKEELMNLYGMDSETYNQIALFAYGVLQPESAFGKDLKYSVKEAAPFLVSLAKGNWFDTSMNSRGPTQIKRIPKKIVEKYGMEKSDLKKPRNSAIATVGFAYELLQELKAISHKHPAINRDNIYQYLYYLYNGKRYEITKATATPHLNIAIKRINSAVKEVKVNEGL
jgi:hypothetical protein